MAGMIQKLKSSPFLGWIAFGLLIVAIVVVNWNSSRSESVTSPEKMKEMVSIKFADTGNVIQMPRGRLDKMLAQREGLIDPQQGIVNPETGQATGFIYDEAEWKSMVDRINALKKQAGVKDVAATPARPGEPPKK
jgi:hypothetical protein